MNEAPFQIYEFDEFRISAAKRVLSRVNGEQIPLTPKVFDTLLYLVRNSGKVSGKDELMREIWTDSVVEENNLNQNISILRRIFGEKPGEQRFIVTVAGHGYRFVPEVRMLRGSAGITPSENVTAPTEGRIENEIQRDGKRRRWFFASAILALFVLGVVGIYVWMVGKKPADVTIKTIAILPFKPLVSENRNEALELGLADTLISELSGSEEIVVRPLSAIRRYNALDQDSLSAARELEVESVLDGTIQTWGDRIRISAKLIRTSDGKQLWSGQFDEKFTDLFAVQDTISEKVAAALKIRIGGKKRPTENIEAYQLYMKGRYHIAKGTPPDLKASIPFFEQAIEIDPGYALAYTGLSHAYGVLGLAGDVSVPNAVSKAREAERKALELDDTLGEAHSTHCMGLFWYDWDWEAAEKACRRSIEIDPNNSDFHGNYAMVLSNTGRHAEALAEARRSRELNPLNLVQNALEGQFLLHAGRTDEALVQLRKMSELEPNFWMPHFIAASAYIEKGMFAEALAESEREHELSGGNVYPLAAYALAKSGKSEEARAALNDLLSETKYTPPYNIALLYNALDEGDEAMNWLEKAYRDRDPKMTFLKVDPKWNNLRNEPRFVDLMKRMHFR
jgi:serine/threonine-protein kinase